MSGLNWVELIRIAASYPIPSDRGYSDNPGDLLSANTPTIPENNFTGCYQNVFGVGVGIGGRVSSTSEFNPTIGVKNIEDLAAAVQ